MKRLNVIILGLASTVVFRGDDGIDIRIDKQWREKVDERYLPPLRRVVLEHVEPRLRGSTKVFVHQRMDACTPIPVAAVYATVCLPPEVDGSYRVDRRVDLCPKNGSLVTPTPPEASGLEWIVHRTFTVRRVFPLQTATAYVAVDDEMSYSETRAVLMAIDSRSISFREYAATQPHEFQLWEQSSESTGVGLLPRVEQVTSVRLATAAFKKTAGRRFEVATEVSRDHGRLYECRFESGKLIVTNILGGAH